MKHPNLSDLDAAQGHVKFAWKALDEDDTRKVLDNVIAALHRLEMVARSHHKPVDAPQDEPEAVDQWPGVHPSHTPRAPVGYAQYTVICTVCGLNDHVNTAELREPCPLKASVPERAVVELPPMPEHDYVRVYLDEEAGLWVVQISRHGEVTILGESMLENLMKGMGRNLAEAYGIDLVDG